MPSSGEAKKLQLPALAAHGQAHQTPLDNTKHVTQMTLLELGESQYTKKGISWKGTSKDTKRVNGGGGEIREGMGEYKYNAYMKLLKIELNLKRVFVKRNSWSTDIRCGGQHEFYLNSDNTNISVL